MESNIEKGLNLAKKKPIVTDAGDHYIIKERELLAVFGDQFRGHNIDIDLIDFNITKWDVKQYRIEITISNNDYNDAIWDIMNEINNNLYSQLKDIDDPENIYFDYLRQEDDEMNHYFVWYFIFNKPIQIATNINEGLNLQYKPKNINPTYAEVEKLLQDIANHFRFNNYNIITSDHGNTNRPESIISTMEDFVSPDKMIDIEFRWSTSHIDKLFVSAKQWNEELENFDHDLWEIRYILDPPDYSETKANIIGKLIELKHEYEYTEGVINESYSDYKKPLLEFVTNKPNQVKNYLKHLRVTPEIIDAILRETPDDMVEHLLSTMDLPVIKNMLSEGKCRIEDVEKKAKKIIFAKYNWDPKDVTFHQEDNAVQILAFTDLKPELQKITEDTVLFKFLESVAKRYNKDLNDEFSTFCGTVKFLRSFSTDVSAQVYCYTIIENGGLFYLYNSNGEKRSLKSGTHPKYLVNKLYYYVGLFASNVLSEGLNLQKVDTTKSTLTNILAHCNEGFDDKHPNSTYFIDNTNKIQMEYNSEYGHLYVDEKFWNHLQERFNLTYLQVMYLVKEVVEANTDFRFPIAGPKDFK